MTRDEALKAISAAFGDVETWAAAGYWVVHVETQPKREITLMRRFVDMNILGGAMKPEALTKHIVSIGDGGWAVGADGVRQLVLT